MFGFGSNLLLQAVLGEELNKGVMVTDSSSVWKRAAPPALTLKPDNSVPLDMSLVLFKLLSLYLEQVFVECKFV